MTAYYNNGKKAEQQFVELIKNNNWFDGYITNDLKLQYQDIDVVMSDGRTVSVKDQSLADKFNSFMFENVQIRTSDGARTSGNIHLCKADLYAIASPTKWFVLDAEALYNFISDNRHTLTRRKTTLKAEAANRRYKGYGCYDRTESFVITYNELRESGTLLWEGKR